VTPKQERFLVAVQQLAMCEDAGTHSRVVISNVTDPHDIKGNFDIISYKKVGRQFYVVMLHTD